MNEPGVETSAEAVNAPVTLAYGSGGEDGQVPEAVVPSNGADDKDDESPKDVHKQPEQGLPEHQLPYQDHNYIGSSASPTSTSAKPSAGAGERLQPQKFRTIPGLESYPTVADGSSQANNGVGTFKRTRHPIQAMANNNVAVNSHGSHPPPLQPRFPAGVQQMAAVRSGGRDYSVPFMGGNSPSGRRYVVAAGGGVQPTLFSPAVGARRVMYPSSSDQFVSHAPMVGLSPQPIRQQLGQPPHQIIQLRRPPMPSPVPTPAMIANDPSLVANQNAPAPFLAPARGPPARGRGPAPPIISSTGGRATVNAVSHGGGGSVKLAGGYHQQMVASPYSRQPVPSGRVQPPPPPTNTQSLRKDTSIQDVLAEEEAQNAQFFQRQLAGKKTPASATENQKSASSGTSSANYRHLPASSVAAASSHLRAPPSDNPGPKPRGRPQVGSLLPSSLLPSPPSSSSSATLVHSAESNEAALAAAHDFVRQQQQQQQTQHVAGKSPVKYFIQTESHPSQAAGMQMGRLLQLPQQQQGALEGLAELAQLSQQQNLFVGSSTFGGVPSPQRLLAQRPAHDYTTAPPSYIRTGSPLKYGQQQTPSVPSTVALPPGAPRSFNVEPDLPATSTPTVGTSSSSSAAPMGSAPQAGSGTSASTTAAGVGVRPRRPVSAGKDLQSLIKSGRAANRHQVTTAADWEGQDYITRCICGMGHDDDFMIECERCNVWQHAVCMDVDPKKVPESYFCEACAPRPLKLTKEAAASLQGEKLKHLEMAGPKGAGKVKGKGGTKRAAETAKRASTISVKNRRATVSGDVSHHERKQQGASENTLSRSMRAYFNAHAGEISNSAKSADDLLKPLKGDVQNAKQMYVAPDVQGLVSVRDVAVGTPIIEYTGYISLASEAGVSKAPHRALLLSYDGLGERINVDASKLGSPARFARRSCKPNTEIQHVLDEEGRLHLVLVANQKIDSCAEVTIPFDYDYTQSTTPVTCACSIVVQEESKRGGEGEICPIRDFNSALLQQGGTVAGTATTALPNKGTPTPIVTSSPPVADKKAGSQRAETKRERSSSPKRTVRKAKGKWAKVASKKKASAHAKKSPSIKKTPPTTPKSPKGSTPPPVKEEEPVETRRRATTRTQTVISNPKTPAVKGERADAEKLVQPPAKEQSHPSTSTTTRATKSTANPSSSAKMVVEQHTPPEPQKLSREERKMQHTMALIEQQERREKQKLVKKSPRAPSTSHEKSVDKTAPPEEKRKDAVVKKGAAGGKASASTTPPPSSTTTHSHPKGKSGAHKAFAFKLRKPAMAQQKPMAKPTRSNASAARDEVVEPEPEPLIPRRAALKRTATVAAMAKIQESSRSPAPKRKQLTPSSSSRSQDDSLMSSTEAAELLADMATGSSTTPSTSRGEEVNIREDLNRHAALTTVGIGEELFSLPSDYNMRPSAAGLRAMKGRSVGEMEEKPGLEAPANKVEPAAPIIKPIIANTKAVKKLTIDEYKRRRTSGSMASPVEGVKVNGAGSSTTSSAPGNRHSFIPSLTAPAVSLFATPSLVAISTSTAATSVRQSLTAPARRVSQAPPIQQPPPPSASSSVPTPSLDELKRRIWGRGATNSQEKVSTGGEPATSTKPTPEPAATKATKVADDDDDDEEESRTMSLEERLRQQFRIGAPSASSSASKQPTGGASNSTAATRSSTRLARESFRQPTALRREDIPPPGLITPNHVGVGTLQCPPPTPPSTPVDAPPHHHSNIYSHQPTR